MSQAGAIRAGKAYVELFTDKNPLVRGLKSAAGDLKAWGSKVRGIGTGIAAAGSAVLAPLLGASHVFQHAGSELLLMSQRTGASVEALGAFKGAAVRTGADIGQLEVGIKKMQKTIFEAANGSDSAKEALAGLGLSAEQLMAMKPEEQFRLIASRMAGITDPTVRTGMALRVMGRAATSLIPLMTHLQEIEARGKRLGPGLTHEDAELAHELEVAWLDLGTAQTKVWLQLGAAVAPAIRSVLDQISPMVGKVAQWAKENRALVAAIAAVAAGVVAAGTAVVGLGTGLSLVGTVIAGLASGLTFLASTPVLVTTALVAGVAAWLAYTDSGQSAISTLRAGWTALSTDALGALQGISDALSAGSLEKAMTVATTFLRLEWEKLWDFVKVPVLDFQIFMEGVWAGIADVMLIASGEMQKAWQNFFGWLSETASRIAQGVGDFFSDTSDEIAVWLLKTTGQSAAAEDEIEHQRMMKRQRAMDRAKAAGAPRAGGFAEIDKATADAREANRAMSAEQIARLQGQKTTSGVGSAQEAFDAAVAAAAAAKEAADAAKGKGPPGGATFPTSAALAKEQKGIGFEDVRSKEGFKPIAEALRQGRDSDAKSTARNTAKLATVAERSQIELRRIRENLDEQDGSDF